MNPQISNVHLNSHVLRTKAIPVFDFWARIEFMVGTG
jgi:hypothetical protein